MLHHIQKLHKHPEHVRERVAIGIAAGVTFIVFLFWASTLDTRLALFDLGGDTQAAAAANAPGLRVVNEKEPDSPATIIKEKVGDAYGSFRDAVGY